MLQDIVTKGSTDRSVTVRIIDSADGTPETGVVFNTSGIALWYRREGAAKVDITEATLAALTTAHADGGFLHVSDGVYRVDLPDAAFATGANYVDFGGTVTGMIVIGGRVRLVDYSLEDAVRMGLTALPNAAAEAAGGLYTRGTGPGQINQPANGMVDANVVRNAGTAIVATGGRQEVNTTHFNGTAATASAGRPEVNTTHAAGTAWGSGAITAGAIATDAIGAAELATDAVTEIVTAVWAAAARTLTANPGLDAAAIRTALGLASANLDTQLTAIDDFLDTEVAAIKSKTDNLPSDPADQSLIIAATDAVMTRLGAPAGASMSADIAAVKTQTAAIETDTQDLQTQVGAAGAGLTALASAAALSTVDTVVDAIKVTTDKLDDTLEDDGGTFRFTTNALEQAPSGGGGGLDAAGVRAAIGLASANLDTQLSNISGNVTAILADTGTDIPASLATIAGYLDTEVGAIKGVVDKLDTAMELDSGTYRFTAAALAEAPAGGGGGSTDWTSTERAHIRHRLGIDGSALSPSATPSLATAATLTEVKGKTDALTFTISGKVDANITHVIGDAVQEDGADDTNWGAAP